MPLRRPGTGTLLTSPGTLSEATLAAPGQDEYQTAQLVAQYPGKGFLGSADLSGAYATMNPTGANGTYNETAGTASGAASAAGPLRTAIVASGTGFQDAEAASTLSYAQDLPILLTTPGSLSPEVATAITALGVGQVIVMGGPLAVSDAVVAQRGAMGVSVLRVAGADDSATAVELADLELGSVVTHVGLGWRQTGGVTIARGDFYSDGLAGAVVAADRGTSSTHYPEPLLLTESPTTVGAPLTAFLEKAGARGIDDRGTPVTQLTVLGGTLAVTNATVRTMEHDLAR